LFHEVPLEGGLPCGNLLLERKGEPGTSPMATCITRQLRVPRGYLHGSVEPTLGAAALEKEAVSKYLRPS
jgi:hypothetical protein